jgi:ribosomal protein S18 acetylase RimI-like enzyme
MMPIVLRPARFDGADAAALAGALETAADGAFRLLFGRRWERVLRAAALHPGHELSLEHATLAVDGEETVGVLHGFLAGDAADPEPVLERVAGWWPLLRSGVVTLAGRPVFRAMERRDPGDWYLQAIAVQPDRRGAGVGSRLLDAALEQARDSGAGRIALDVDAANGRARRLYERYGFQVAGTSRRAWLLGGLRVHRMARRA